MLMTPRGSNGAADRRTRRAKCHSTEIKKSGMESGNLLARFVGRFVGQRSRGKETQRYQYFFEFRDKICNLKTGEGESNLYAAGKLDAPFYQ